MRLVPLLAISVALTCIVDLRAQPVGIHGIIAKRETDLLTYEDKLAAYDAEQVVLANEWGSQGYDWKGPNGAYGTIISSGSIPQPNSNAFCRRFIHIVHHANDGGANPTFQGMICRASPDAEWVPR